MNLHIDLDAALGIAGLAITVIGACLGACWILCKRLTKLSGSIDKLGALLDLRIDNLEKELRKLWDIVNTRKVK
jgi:hypothetical protein